MKADQAIKKNPLSFQSDMKDFAPVSAREKQQQIIMRESVSFLRDAMRRFGRNKLAMLCLSMPSLFVNACTKKLLAS